MTGSYYADKLATLKEIFGSQDIYLEADRLVVDSRAYPILDDVIVLLAPEQYPASLASYADRAELPDFAEDIQFTFGSEWKTFPGILPEHEQEFSMYFDLVDTNALCQSRACDLGCA